MIKNLYVGNLDFSATEDEVRELFAQHGEVKSVKVISDRKSDRPRGFGFVEMENVDNADNAIRELDGKEFKGRNLKVNEARPPVERGDFSRERGFQGGNRGYGNRRY